jgi:outer membrane protein assembly factor BamB
LNQNLEKIWVEENYHPAYDCGNVLIMVSKRPLSESIHRTTYDIIAINSSNGNKLWSFDSNNGYLGRLACRGIDESDFGDIYIQPDLKNIFGSLLLYDSDEEILILLNKENGNIELKGNKIDTRGYGGNKFLGGTSDKLFYSNDKFGITQAYDTTSHSLIWENSKISLESISGILENMLIGSASTPEIFKNELITIDINTGTILWRKEYDVGNNLLFIKNNTLILYSPYHISILNNKTGEIQSSRLSSLKIIIGSNLAP